MTLELEIKQRFLALGYADPELVKQALEVIKPYWLERVGGLTSENHRLKTIFLKPTTKAVVGQVIQQHGNLDAYTLLQILETQKLNAYYHNS